MVKILSNKLSEIKDMAKFEPTINANEVSRIAQDVVIKGDFSSRSDVRVDGQLDGTIYSEGRIVVGETAVLKGRLLCSNVDFWGRMDGDLYVKDVLSIKGTAVINGNIHVRKLQVEMGAQVNGSCKMIDVEEFDKACKDVVAITLPEVPAPKKSAPKIPLFKEESAKELA